MQTRYKALAALLISIMGAAVVYSHSGSFWGGLLFSGFIAATIGGLADWFAVTALFRRPLGISYRTAIIPRNRERILGDLVDFICSDLLKPATIMEIAGRYKMTDFLFQYIEYFDGRDKIKVLAHKLIYAMVERLDTERLSDHLTVIVRQNLQRVHAAPVLWASIKWSLANRYDADIINFLLNETTLFVRDGRTNKVLAELVEATKQEYIGDHIGRQMAGAFLSFSPESVAAVIQRELTLYLEGLKASGHPLKNKVQEYLLRQVEAVEHDKRVGVLIDAWIERMVDERFDVRAQIESVVRQAVEQLTPSGQLAPLADVNYFIDRQLDNLQNDKALQERIDSWLKRRLASLVEEQHGIMVDIVEERLSTFSNDSLVEFVESRIADDLQIIRINGSLVGALVGMLLYVVTYAARLGV